MQRSEWLNMSVFITTVDELDALFCIPPGKGNQWRCS